MQMLRTLWTSGQGQNLQKQLDVLGAGEKKKGLFLGRRKPGIDVRWKEEWIREAQLNMNRLYKL
jgi:hypothetical protein